MSRKIKIVSVRRDKLDTKLAVLAFIALARQLESQHQQKQSRAPRTDEGSNDA